MHIKTNMKGFTVKRSRKIFIWIIITVITAGIINSMFKKNSSHTKNATKVSLAQAQISDLAESISAPGEIAPKNKVQISAKVSARIIKLPFKEGDTVTKGNADASIPASLIVKLDAKNLESELRSVKASYAAQTTQIKVEQSRLSSQKENLKGTQASMVQAELDLQRQLKLLKSKDISQSAYDQAKLKYDGLKAQFSGQQYSLKAAELNLQVMQHNLDAAEARIEQAQEKLGYTTIYSPINGVITRLNSKVGEVVTGTISYPGTVIMEVADLSQMLVVAQVGEADIGKIKIKQRAAVSVQALPDDEFHGTIESIALTHSLSSSGTKYYRTEILLDNDPNVSKLYCGLTGHVEIETRKHKSVLTLPSQAILGRAIDSLPLKIRDTSKQINKKKTFTPVVYRYINGKAVVTPVKLGPNNLTHTIISSGLSVNDKVIIGPYKVLDNLKHDQAVKDERESSAKDDPNEPGKAHGK